MGRDNGFNGPLGVDQVFTWVTIPVLFACFFVASASFLPDDGTQSGVLAVTSVLFIALIGFWFYCEYVDPSKPGGLGCLCMRETQKSVRFCAHCRKSVPGLDHHCTWLNTCVGKRNYWAFYLLSLTGTVSFVLQSILYILMVTTYRNEQNSSSVGSEDAYIAILVVAILLSFGAVGAFGSLCAFHTYLLITHQSTYDWLLAARNKKLERFAKRATRQATKRNKKSNNPKAHTSTAMRKSSPATSPGGSEASGATATATAPTTRGITAMASASASNVHIEEEKNYKKGKATKRSSTVAAALFSDSESESPPNNNQVMPNDGEDNSQMSEI